MASFRTRRQLAIGGALVLAACDQGADSVNCDLLARDLERAARCIVKYQADGEAITAECEGEAAKFRTAGFTSHDATKIAATSVKSFYTTYYGKDFCKHYFPQWLTRKFN